MAEPTDALQRFDNEQVLALHALADAMYLEQQSLSAFTALLTASEIMTLMQTAISQILAERSIPEPELDMSQTVDRVRAATSALGIEPLASDEEMAVIHEHLLEIWEKSGLA